MKILKHLRMAACLSLLLQSCDEKQDLTIYTISGYLYQNCTMEPSANEHLELIQDLANPPLGGSSVPDYLRATCTTDSNGYYKFEFTVENKQDELIIRTGAASNLLNGIPSGENIADLVVYKYPTCNIQVSLNVMNAYTEEDTLVIGDYRTLDNMYIPCPLTSGILYTAENFNLLSMFYLGETKYINWFITPYNDNSILQEFTIDKYCSDTIYVTLDIY